MHGGQPCLLSYSSGKNRERLPSPTQKRRPAPCSRYVLPVRRRGSMRRNWTLHRFVPVLLIAVGVAAYQNSFGGAFFFDDHTAIRDNPHIGQLWPPGAWQPPGEST